MKNILIIPFILCGLFLNQTLAQGNLGSQKKLRKDLEKLIGSFHGTVGVSVNLIENSDTLSINNQNQYPMQSVYKFPLAMAILDQVDKNKLKLNQKVHISKADLLPKTWSPLRDSFPEGNIDKTIAELLDYSVSKSDNNVCDILFRLAGGTEAVNQYFQQLGYSEIEIKTTEAEMAAGDAAIQNTNWCKPTEMTKLLIAFYQGKHLSPESTRFLMQLMIESSNTPMRIKGRLPKTTVVAHKTGTGNKVVNDVGIITLSNGRHLAICLFIKDANEKFEKTETLMAKISRTIYNYYETKN